MNGRSRSWADVPPFTCVICLAPLHRIPHRGGLDEWQWADAQGSPSRIDPDLVHLYDPQLNPVGATDPYDALNKLAALMDTAGAARKACLTWVYWQAAREYSALKTRLDVSATFHQHEVSPATPAPHHGPVPRHCGQPMRLAPSGWRCRACNERTDA
jgi:hypothetical protein